MSKFFNLTKKVQKSHSASGIRINIKTLNIILVTMIVISGLGFLVQTNGLAAKGYQIKDLEDKISGLQQEKADLELESLSLQSMGNVQQKVDNLGMVLANEAEYLRATPVALAR